MKNRKYKILIIDDDTKIINSIIDILEVQNPNYIFYQVTNGEIGYKLAKKHKPDIIITDWEMPVIDGIETIKLIKSDNSTSYIPIIMLTGKMTNSENLKTALEAGAIDFIRKPIDEIELSARVNSTLLYAASNKEVIDLKNKELSQITLSIVQHNELIEKLKKQIVEINLKFAGNNTRLKIYLKDIIKELESKLNNTETWEKFDENFELANPDFYKNITNKHPELTLHELKVCAIIRLGLSTKDIASLLYIEPTSVKSLRYRIRQKLNLNQGENLQNYLMTF